VVTPREAATVMLVRDAPELEVFMVRRSHALVFVGGASVFPGGAVDAGDRDPVLHGRCRGWTDATASAAVGVPEGGLRFWVAAVRETFEEAGVLLARRSDGEPVDGAAPELSVAREALNRGDTTFATLLRDLDLELDTEGLRPCSRWITPAGAPRRYDTRFFVTAAPTGHAYAHDDGEAVASGWVQPAAALAAFDRGEIDLILPTQRCLQALAAHRHASDALVGLEGIHGNAGSAGAA